MTSRSASVQFIFATIFLDALGIGLIIPIMPDIIRRFSNDPILVARYFGYFISVYALMQFLASPVLGALSDRYGRRPLLLISLFGSAIDYVVMAFAPGLGILFMGRVISGLTGANFSVATAYMADISDDSNRSVNFGMIGGAFGLGFVIGPVLGGLVGSIGPHACFLAAAGLNLLNLLFGYFVLPESLVPENRREVAWSRLNPFKSLARFIMPSPLLVLIWVYVLLFLAGQVHPSTWTLYTQNKFHWTAVEVGLSLSFVGIVIAGAQGGLTRVMIPRLGENRTLLIGLILNMLAFGAFAFATHGWMMYAIMAASAPAGLSGPAIQSLISRQVPANEQGELQGTLVSLASLTAIVGPLIFTELFAYFTGSQAPIEFAGAPYLGAALICALTLALFLAFRDRAVATVKAP